MRITSPFSQIHIFFIYTETIKVFFKSLHFQALKTINCCGINAPYTVGYSLLNLLFGRKWFILSNLQYLGNQC